jgi:hypothetical protein
MSGSLECVVLFRINFWTRWLESREWSDQIPEDDDDDLEDSMFQSILRMNEEADENEALPRTIRGGMSTSTIPNLQFLSLKRSDLEEGVYGGYPTISRRRGSEQWPAWRWGEWDEEKGGERERVRERETIFT